MEGVLPQRVIVYVTIDGGVAAYDTAYSAGQDLDGIRRCSKKHQIGSRRVTVVADSDLDPKRLTITPNRRK